MVSSVYIHLVSEFPSDFRIFSPGLETYYACKYASRNNVSQFYGGVAFDPLTIEALRHQPDLYSHLLIWRSIFHTRKLGSSWTSQYNDFLHTLQVRGAEAFAESIDRSRINFLVGLLSKMAPKQKQILVDQRDVRIFCDLYKLKEHKNIVAVVNQWHMEGIETHWRRQTKTIEEKPHLSPVHDMNIDAVQEQSLIN